MHLNRHPELKNSELVVSIRKITKPRLPFEKVFNRFSVLSGLSLPIQAPKTLAAEVLIAVKEPTNPMIPQSMVRCIVLQVSSYSG